MAHRRPNPLGYRWLIGNGFTSDSVTQFVRKLADQAEAERYWNVPYPALEEALVNAVYHRSYEEREPIEVRITPTEITILSFPGPDAAISMEDLRAGKAVARRYRNRRIGEFLKELELSEGRGTGIPKILESMRSNGSEEPAFDTDANRASFLVRLPLRANKVELAVSVRGSSYLSATLEKRRVEPKVVGRMAVSTVKLILEACREARRPGELQTLLQLRDRITLLYGYLGPLMQQGWLSRTQPRSRNSPTQRYITTAAGETWLAEHSVD